MERRPANKIFHDTARVTALVVEHVPRGFHSDLQTPRWQTVASVSRTPETIGEILIRDTEFLANIV